MKKVPSSVVFLLTVFLCFLAPSKQTFARDYRIFASSLADGGRLTIKHSPILGINVGIEITIDGVQAGGISKGHLYSRYLAPGPHRLTVTRNGRGWDAWRSVLYVRRGETYSYTAKYNTYKIVLQPAAPVR